MNNGFYIKLLPAITQYTQMSVAGFKIHCPYWMNRMKNGRVILRGVFNGKGKAREIANELNKRWEQYIVKNPKENNTINIYKLAKRERIGIDCSGLVYRLLDDLIKTGFGGNKYLQLDEIFPGGVNRTNARTLTGKDYTVRITEFQSGLGDLIRINGGKHVIMILSNDGKLIKYVHSHHRTVEKGVHVGIIEIKDKNRSLNFQKWQEMTTTGENFRTKYFHPELGDGIFRLKAFI